MAQMFHRVDVLTDPSGLNMIWWRMDGAFNPLGGSVDFYVDWARSGGDWTCLNASSPVVDGCVFLDPVKRNFNMSRNMYYRVRASLVTSSVVASLPAQALGSLTDEEYLNAKEIARLNYLDLKKRGGIHGYLLKRREWGTPCPECSDFDMGEATRGSCSICFGTSFVGGYYPAVDYWIKSQPRSPRSRGLKPEGLGEADPQVRVVYGVAYPWIEALDLWVDSKSNERWIIRKVGHRADMSSKPILFDLELHRLPDTSPAMDIPMAAGGEAFVNEWRECPPAAEPLVDNFPDKAGERVASGQESDRGWRKGLEGVNW